MNALNAKLLLWKERFLLDFDLPSLLLQLSTVLPSTPFGSIQYFNAVRTRIGSRSRRIDRIWGTMGRHRAGTLNPKVQS